MDRVLHSSRHGYRRTIGVVIFACLLIGSLAPASHSQHLRSNESVFGKASRSDAERSGRPSTPASAGTLDSLERYIEYVRLDPLVLQYADETFTLRIAARDSNVSGIRIRLVPLTQRNGEVDVVWNMERSLDASPYPVFELRGLSQWSWYEGSPWDEQHVIATELTIELTTGREIRVENVELPSTIRKIDPERVSIPEPAHVASNLWATEYVANPVGERNRLWRLDGPTADGELFGWGDRFLFEQGQKSAYQVFYDHFPDDRDYLFHLDLAHFRLPRTQGPEITVKNAIRGIGLRSNVPGAANEWDVFDYSARYGSSGKLQSVTELTRLSMSFWIFNQRVVSRFGMNIDRYLTEHQGWDKGLGVGGSGWTMPNTFRDVIERETDSTYRVFPINCVAFVCAPYNDFELYLMGLLPEEAVEDTVWFLQNAEFVDYEGFNRYRADAFVPVTIHDIVAALGPRVPSWADAPKDFRAGLIVPYDRPLTPVEFAYFDFVMREYEKSESSYEPTFEYATGGRATMTTRLHFEGVGMENPEPSPVAQAGFNDIWPNPAGAVSRISFSIPRAGHTRIVAYDALGRRIATLVDGPLPSGSHSVTFSSESLADGVYFLRLDARGGVETRRLLVVK